MATPTKDRITCHVLDTSLGRPARGMRVRLELTQPSSAPAPTSSSSSSTAPTTHHHPAAPSRTFESQTDDDGRVKVWLPFSADNDSGEVPVYTLDDVLLAAADATSRWTLRFDTAAYFAGREGEAGAAEKTETFFPEVVVVFEVKPGQQYHVPLLLSPYGYTTYRGS